ncbi:MarR family winged helix-turn-helix transcriptional regulator [Streptomyces sp. NBC_00568]|uniref:MarR family winged helix-turn-helix transcriptional regulator n=1 Tax=Streptomyces sp. NBC_00568 TaxID=2975779 RepID=UPI002255CD20|nr:MarR family transcriptional regulator [Streptomyces sp. NBC_00568]MCX4993590.1 MarR family transcriptional regulator [Streptomyces sp. NBC_00568]
MPASASGGRISHAIFRVARVHRLITGQLLRHVGLYPGQELVMMHLWERGPQRQVDLIRLIDSDAPTMTRTVRRLEQAGFVRRSSSATDKRSVIVEPTAASQALRREVEQLWAELEDITLGELTAEEQTGTLRALERLEDNLTSWNAPDD